MSNDNDFVDEEAVTEPLEEKKQVEEPKPKPKAKEKVNALRISGVRGGQVMFKGVVDDEVYLRLIPVEEWSGKDEQEFEKMMFFGFERPGFANR